jgi:hypothetical protein
MLDFSLLHSVQTGSGAHPASYPMRTGVPFPGGLSGRGLKLNTHFHLVPGPERLSYTFTPACIFMV